MTRVTAYGSVLAVGRWRLAVGVALLLSAGACQGESRRSKADSGGRSVVVYSSADKEFAELVFRAYEQKTGVSVLPLYDTEETKTAGLTARLLAERAYPKADVVWSSDTSRAVAIAEQDVAERPHPRAAVQHEQGPPTMGRSSPPATPT